MSFDSDQETSTFMVDRVLHVTDKAALCRIEGEDYWIPFSEMDPESPLLDGREGDDEFWDLKGESGSLTIPMWLAKEKGIE